MSPRTKEQVERIRHEKKDVIATAALKLFSEHGYKGTSISMIAKEAGISKGLMYNYYESKEQLLHEIMQHGVTSLLMLFDHKKDGIITKDDLITMVNMSFDFMIKNADFYRLFFSLLLQPVVYELVNEDFWKSAEPFQQMMCEYYVKENFEDPEAEVALLLAILDGVGMHYLFRPDQYPIESVKKLIIDRIIKKPSA